MQGEQGQWQTAISFVTYVTELVRMNLAWGVRCAHMGIFCRIEKMVFFCKEVVVYLYNVYKNYITVAFVFVYFPGDIAHYDENGYFFITERLKELIKYKGFQVNYHPYFLVLKKSPFHF